MADEKRDIVKYDNDFTLSTNFNRLSKVQQAIFFTGVSYLVKQRSTHVVISADDIKQKANLVGNAYTKKKYYEIIHGIEEIVLHTIFRVRAEGKEWRGVLFDTFALDDATGDFEMFLNPHASRYFFDIPGSFSLYELEAFLSLRSKFAQILFREFLARYAGSWTPSVADLVNCFKLDIDNKGKTRTEKATKTAVANFVGRLDKYIDDVRSTGYFINISYTVNHKPGRGSPVESISFKFDRSNKKALELKGKKKWEPPKPVIEEKKHERQEFVTNGDGHFVVNRTVEVEKIQKKCPICHAGLLTHKISNGKIIEFCENNERWGLGTKSCQYCRFIDQSDKTNE